MNIKRVVAKWLFIFRRKRRPSRVEIDLILATRKRAALTDTRFIGVTGSAGKSSTSALLFFLLGARYQTAGSLLHNALKDIAHRLIDVEADDQFVVVEMSGHEPGALASGCSLVQPTMAIITAVSSDHFANFRSLEATALEKSSLASAIGQSGTVFLNLDDPLVAGMVTATEARVLTFGLAEKADYRALNPMIDGNGRLIFVCTYLEERIEFNIGLPALHFVSAALAAIGCAHQAGIPLKVLAERALHFTGLHGRCSIHHISHQRQIICDTVKAPYPTLELAFGVLSAFHQAKRRTIVLGNFSDYAGAFSRKLRKAVQMGLEYADRILLFKPPHDVKKLIDAYGPERVGVVDSVDMLRDVLEGDILEGEVVLLKASSVNKLDALVQTYSSNSERTEDAAFEIKELQSEWSRCSEGMEDGLVRMRPGAVG